MFPGKNRVSNFPNIPKKGNRYSGRGSTKGSKVDIKTTRALITHDEVTRNENKITQRPQFFEIGWEGLGSNSGYSFKIKREKMTFEP